MKYSGLQEDTYGVGLPQNRHPADMDEVMMAVTEDLVLQNDTTTEEGSIVSNLPLLFADGYPTSLEKISLAQLERFITFMVQCSSGYEKAEVINEPQWWSKEVKFSNPLIRPKKFNDNWIANLKKLVFRCYTYHRSEYLLRFCSYLARYPHEELEFVNNWDSTTSLYHKNTGKLLVTFRDENMNYDKKSDSPRKTLLAHNGNASNAGYKSKQQHSFAMVQPPCDDIYLCDNCDAEFVGLEKMKEHERTCYEHDQPSSGSRPTTPDLSITEPELGQNKFLEYFHLSLKSSEIQQNKPPEKNICHTVVSAVPRRTSNRVRGPISLTRSPSIPFSSPAGIMLAKKSKTMTEETQQERLERIERHSMAPPLTEACRPKWMDREAERDRWVVTYRQNRDKPEGYVHQYNFNSFKGKPMLSIRSQLMYLLCRPVRIVLSRVTEDEISALKKSSSKSLSIKTSFPRKRAGPASKTKLKLQTTMPTKRKAPEEEEEEQSEPTVEKNDTATKTAITTSALTSLNTVLPYIKSERPTSPTTENTSVQPPTSNAIMVIDLCSSDEEENNVNIPVTSDENWDPMKSTDNGIKKTLLKTHTPIKNCSTSCIYPANPTNDWLSENIFSDDSENCANRCSNVVLNASPRISPIIRPAP